jgi:probable aminopeptidase NPEPL1
MRVQILAVDASGAPIQIPEIVATTLRASRAAAELVDTPPAELDPETFAAKAHEQLADNPKVKVREIVGDALLKQRLRGIHAVGRCATKAPRMLVASYDPRIPKARRIALVGKGVTFDAGGLHIKARGMMETMKSDMGGAAATLGAFSVLARTGCKHKLSLILCLAENAIGPAAYKPDDILKLHSGKTVEINNTDAEGRLLLADGASYAARTLGADVVFDAATLTGAQLVATGVLHAGVVTNDEELERLMIEAGRASGDLCHALPFAPEIFKEEFSTPIADMKNSVENRSNAQSSCAAQFVYWHIEDAPGARRRRWCHVDLAGPAFPRDRATGYGVALISEAVRRL